MLNWHAIQPIYSKDHATGAGARTGGECARTPVVEAAEVDEETPEPPPKRQRTGDAIMCMMGRMQCSFEDALKSTVTAPKVTPPAEILDALKKIEGLEAPDVLTAYGKLIVNERLFEALMALPIDMRKPWLLSLQ